MNERLKDWLQIVVLMVQTIGIVWYVSQQMQEIRDRLTFLESQQTISRAIEDKLNQAREDSNNHLTHLDDQMSDALGKLDAILQQLASPGGTQNSAPQNFTSSPRGP